LYNEELDNWYSSPNINRQIKSSRKRWAGHVARIGEERKVCRLRFWWQGKPEGRRPLGRPNRRWNGIRMDLREIDWGGRVDPAGSGYGPDAGSYKYGDGPSGFGATEIV
jgi:hypothetical protein